MHNVNKDKQELRLMLKGETGREFLQSAPLLEACIESSTILGLLRRCCDSFLPKVEKELDVKLTLVAFGSLGRLEFVPRYSDFDPLIILGADSAKKPSDNAIRSAVLIPLARMCPWLRFDDSSNVMAGGWSSIKRCELKYPVYQ